jgi:hypothetical protein
MLAPRTLLQFAALGAFLAVPNGALRARDNLAPVDIQVRANGFGRASSADISALVESTALTVWRYCEKTQLAGIDVYHRTDHPQTDLKRTPEGRIAIGLAVQDTHWAQYGFQFAHEFCHALANFSNRPQRLVRYPPRANFWLEESLCETASLFALRAMSRTWRTAPPYPAWKSYAPWLEAYAQQRMALPEHRLPKGTSFADWFNAHHSALRRNPALRDWNSIIAIQLLPIFESEPRGWEAITFLNRSSVSGDESLAQHLADWRARCPADLRPFVDQLAAVFVIKLPHLPKR